MGAIKEATESNADGDGLAAGDVEKVSCGPATVVDQTNKESILSCRMALKTVEKGKTGESRTRNANFPDKVKEMFNKKQKAKRRLGRKLAEEATTTYTESAQTYSFLEDTSFEGNSDTTTGTTTGEGGNTPGGNTPSPNDMADDDLLSGAGRPICSLGI